MKKSQITYAVWPWGTQTREQAELAAKEISDIGYKSFESVKQAIYAYDLNVALYRDMLNKYGLKAESFYFTLPVKGEENGFFANLEKEMNFVAELGVQRATLQGTFGRPDIMDEAEKEYNLINMVKFAKLAKSFGIETNVHPHVNTYIMFADEIDYAMENSDKELISFAPDTAHIAATGANVAEVMRKHLDRICYMHLKDYKLSPEITTPTWVGSGASVMTCFHPLGDGILNFTEILGILEKANYTAPLCIELDKAPVSNAYGAKKNYDYLCKFLED